MAGAQAIYFDPSRNGYANPEGHVHFTPPVGTFPDPATLAPQHSPDLIDDTPTIPAAAPGEYEASPSGGAIDRGDEPVHVITAQTPRPRHGPGHRAPAHPFEYVGGAPVAHVHTRHPQAEPKHLLDNLQARHADERRQARPDVRAVPGQLAARLGLVRQAETFRHRQATPLPRPKHGLR